MMSVTFGISPFQGQTTFCDYSSGLHPTLSDISLSAIYAKDMESVDALMEEVTKRAQKAKADNQAGLFEG